MIPQYLQYFTLIKHLIHADFLKLRHDFLHKCIDRTIWILFIVFFQGYLVTSEFQISQNRGLFIIGSALASTGFVEMYYYIFTLVNDIESEHTIFYYLNLPMPSWLYITKNILYYALRTFIMGLPIIPLGKLVLWHSFDLQLIMWPQLICLYILSCFLYGSIALLFASFLPHIDRIDNLWFRAMFPLWFFGGFNHSWDTVYDLSKVLGYLALLNPLTYAMEGIRGALIGTFGSLSFPVCALALIAFTTINTIVTLYKLKQRLDWI